MSERVAPVANPWPATPADRGWAQLIRQSWLRCRSQFELKPEIRREPSVLGVEEIRRRRRELGGMFDIAALEMQALQRSLGVPAGLTLTDAEGVILYYHGAPAFTREAQRAGMREGAIWTEAEVGTNGIGTCLVALAPVLIHREDHFLRQNAAMVCCAAPIRDGRGEVIAVLNLSYGHGESAAATLALVSQTARSIEMHALLQQARDRYVIRLHAHPALVTSGSGALILADEAGLVTGLNQTARDWLGEDGATALIGEPLARSLGLDLRQLGDWARRSPWQPQRLGVDELYVLVQPPQTATLPGADVLDQAERQALLDMVESCGWNITQAAARLNIDRKTLHRKLQRHGLSRPQ